MAINFPDSPNNGDSFTSNNKTWVFDGTVWNITSGTNSVADGAITAAKIASNAVTSDKITAGAVNQSKLGTTFSGITITTTANRDTNIPSPFTGQFCFLTDTSLLQRYTGSAWVNAVATAPAAPTALSGTALGSTSVSIAFTPGADNGSAITNYQYALSTNGGSTYGSFLALDPADSTSPITISGLSAGVSYTIKLKAVNTMGAGTESAGVSVATPLTVEYLVIAGGGGGGAAEGGGGGGAGGYRTNVAGATSGRGSSPESSLTVTPGILYTASVGSGGAGATTYQTRGSSGSNSVFNTITSIGGGGGGGGGNGTNLTGLSGGAGGGGTGGANLVSIAGGAGTAAQGFDGGAGYHYGGVHIAGGGGGGAGVAGGNGTTATTGTTGTGGNGLSSSITGSAVTRGGGGSGGAHATSITVGAAGTGGGGTGALFSGNATAGTVNTGGGGGGAGNNVVPVLGSGGSGVIILRYSNTSTITLGAGLTGSTATDGAFKVTTITAGSGNVSWA